MFAAIDERLAGIVAVADHRERGDVTVTRVCRDQKFTTATFSLTRLRNIEIDTTNIKED